MQVVSSDAVFDLPAASSICLPKYLPSVALVFFDYQQPAGTAARPETALCRSIRIILSSR